jgi:ABC-type transport system involved in multi-copper enzyme maturation permease subunit
VTIKPAMAELKILWKRPGTWILLGIWLIMAMMFGYVVPYINLDNTNQPSDLQNLLPSQVAANTLVGFPFFGGVIVLILAVMTFGGDYGWNVIKTLLTQRSRRIEVFGSKLLALFLSLVPFVVVDFGFSVVASELVASAKSASTSLPGASTLLTGMLAAWLILAVWTALGVLLATITRGTSLAIGIGILYGLVIEGLMSNAFDGVDALSPLIKGFLRTNAYSLVRPIGDVSQLAQDNGPGAFNGPYVGGGQALIVLAAYLAILSGISAYLFKSRDVT